MVESAAVTISKDVQGHLELASMWAICAVLLWFANSDLIYQRRDTWQELQQTRVQSPQGTDTSFAEAQRRGWVLLSADSSSNVRIVNNTPNKLRIKGPRGNQSEVAPQEAVSVPSMDDTIRSIMRPLVSLIAFGFALAVILMTRYTPTQKHWASGTIGTVIGFWLK